MEGEWHTIEYDIHMHVQILICKIQRKIMTMNVICYINTGADNDT